MEPVVLATWGLVVATVILGVISAVQTWSIHSQAKRAEQRDLAQMAC